MTDSLTHSDATTPPAYDPRLTNEDLAPLREQRWGSYNFFAFWMSDVHSVGGYVTAGSLFALGLAAWQVLVALLIGISIVYVLCNLVARPSQATGTPYPVISRVAFGVLGANIPAIIRGLIAVAWYGIQTYLASASLVVVALKLWPGIAPVCRGRHVRVRRPLVARLGRVPRDVGAAGRGVLERHGGDPQVHRLLRTCRLCGDVPARRLPRDGGGLGQHRPEPGRRHHHRMGLGPGDAHRDRARGVLFLRADAQLRRLRPVRAHVRGGQARQLPRAAGELPGRSRCSWWSPRPPPCRSSAN